MTSDQFQWRICRQDGYPREQHVAMLNGSVAGTVSLGVDEQTWWAFGCLNEWEDTPLGYWGSPERAKLSVENWITRKFLEKHLSAVTS